MAGVLKSRTVKLSLGTLAAVSLVLSVALSWLRVRRPVDEFKDLMSPEVAKMDLRSLRKQIGLMERRIQKMQERQNHLFPSGLALLVDSAENQIYLIQGSRLVKAVASLYRRALDRYRHWRAPNDTPLRYTVQIWLTEDDSQLLFWSLPKEFKALIIDQ